MAIPNHTTITCPACGMSEDVIIGDVSIGPQGRTSDTPIYVLQGNPLWSQTTRDGERWISCTTCGAAEFTSVTAAAKGAP